MSHMYSLQPATLRKISRALRPAGSGMEVKQAAWSRVAEVMFPQDWPHLAEGLFGLPDVY